MAGGALAIGGQVTFWNNITSKSIEIGCAAGDLREPRNENGRALLVHCAKEMAHLASFKSVAIHVL
jgi:hypothetical protein